MNMNASFELSQHGSYPMMLSSPAVQIGMPAIVIMARLVIFFLHLVMICISRAFLFPCGGSRESNRRQKKAGRQQEQRKEVT